MKGNAEMKSWHGNWSVKDKQILNLDQPPPPLAHSSIPRQNKSFVGRILASIVGWIHCMSRTDVLLLFVHAQASHHARLGLFGRSLPLESPSRKHAYTAFWWSMIFVASMSQIQCDDAVSNGGSRDDARSILDDLPGGLKRNLHGDCFIFYIQHV